MSRDVKTAAEYADGHCQRDTTRPRRVLGVLRHFTWEHRPNRRGSAIHIGVPVLGIASGSRQEHWRAASQSAQVWQGYHSRQVPWQRCVVWPFRRSRYIVHHRQAEPVQCGGWQVGNLQRTDSPTPDWLQSCQPRLRNLVVARRKGNLITNLVQCNTLMIDDYTFVVLHRRCIAALRTLNLLNECWWQLSSCSVARWSSMSDRAPSMDRTVADDLMITASKLP
jgi:hypothetical protein